MVKHLLTTSIKHELDVLGHRSSIRYVIFSSDNKYIATASNEQVKIWYLESNISKRPICITTLETGYALRLLFVPGNEYIIIACKTGEIELWNIIKGDLISKISAHPDSTIWSLYTLPKDIGFASGGSDKEIKFWRYMLLDKQQENNDIDIMKSSTNNEKILSLVHTGSLKLTDDCLCLAYSPNNKYICTGLLDNTIKIYHQDSLNFFLSLYGHKLPVLCLDISSDSQLLISGSADKNIKIWGLEHGDCHKSLFAHNDSVMSVKNL